MKITQRSSKHPIVFTGSLQGISETIPLKISASFKSWEALLLLATHDRNEFVKHFLLDVIHPVLKTASWKLPKDYQRKIEYKVMKILAVLFLFYFDHKGHSSPLEASIEYMAKVWPEKKEIFDTSIEDGLEDQDIISMLQRFEAGYIVDGKMILQKICKQERSSVLLLHHLLSLIEKRLQDAGNKKTSHWKMRDNKWPIVSRKNRKTYPNDHLILAYNLAAAVYMNLVDQNLFGPCEPIRQRLNEKAFGPNEAFQTYLDERYEELLSMSRSWFPSSSSLA